MCNMETYILLNEIKRPDDSILKQYKIMKIKTFL